MEPKQEISPSWNDIFKEIGIQLRRRSGILTKRVLWICAPALIFFFIARFIAGKREYADVAFQIEGIYLMTFIVTVLAIATIVMMAVSKVEQVIWLDSYFDQKNLTPQESWKIAKRLYLPWCRLQSKLFWRYYVWIIVAIVAVFLSMILFTSDFARSLPGNTVAIAWAFLVGITGIFLVLWTRYLKIKLSYAPFIFLDKYQGSTSPEFWKDFFNELQILNEISKGKMFEKNVLMELGADVAVTLVEWISTQMMARLGPVGGILVLGGKEVGIRIIYFAKLTGRYVLYRFAFKVAHSETHFVNEYIYNLKSQD